MFRIQEIYHCLRCADGNLGGSSLFRSKLWFGVFRELQLQNIGHFRSEQLVVSSLTEKTHLKPTRLTIHKVKSLWSFSDGQSPRFVLTKQQRFQLKIHHFQGSSPKKTRNKVEVLGMFLSFVKGVIKGANFQIPAVSCWVVYVSGENLPAIYWEQNSGGSIHHAVNCTCGKCMAIRNTVLANLFKPSHEKSTYKLCYRTYHCEILWILQTWIKRWIIHTYFQVERSVHSSPPKHWRYYDFVTGSSPEVLFLPIISEDFCIWETSYNS